VGKNNWVEIKVTHLEPQKFLNFSQYRQTGGKKEIETTPFHFQFNFSIEGKKCFCYEEVGRRPSWKVLVFIVFFSSHIRGSHLICGTYPWNWQKNKAPLQSIELELLCNVLRVKNTKKKIMEINLNFPHTKNVVLYSSSSTIDIYLLVLPRIKWVPVLYGRYYAVVRWICGHWK